MAKINYKTIIISTNSHQYFTEHNLKPEDWNDYARKNFNDNIISVFYEGNTIGYTIDNI